MSRGLAALAVIVAAFVIMMGILGVFAWIATAFPTTEDAFVKIGPTPKLEGPVMGIVSVIFVAAGYFLVRFASKISR